MKDLTGSNLKGYELQERLGAGGFGAVYRATQSTVGREVAIKIILPGHANQPEFIRRFETEAHLIARLEHHHIVPLYDYWRDPNGAYLVMRWLRGGSLLDQIRSNGALSIEETAIIIDQLSQALQTAHRNKVIHRDIKPGNILMDEDGNAFLADFGIAKDHTVANDITNADNIVGSPDYLSPEQARSEPVTPQTDIYSLGVVLYEMLEGKHPFPNLSPVERLFKHLNEPLPELETPDDDIRDDLNQVVQKATAKDPMQRFKDVMELAQALRDAAQIGGSQADVSLVELLTPREQEVLQLIIDGKSNREIAERLVLTLATVKSYVSRIYKKLNVRSRMQAIVKARDLDLVFANQDNGDSQDISWSALPEPDNPYKGLQAFQAGDTHDFFGRDKLIEKLISRLQEDVQYRRFLSIVGPSGSGKSSVTRAGLVPALWRGDLPGSDNWYIVDFLPGNRPLDELEVALLKVAGNANLGLREQLERDAHGLIRAANLILPDDTSELLIVIDQFEEVFTLVENEDDRKHFLGLLQNAITDERSRVRIITTLRADYYDRPLQYPEFGELMRTRVETVLPLSANELEQAIRLPSENIGVRFEDGLVSKIVSDVHYQPGALPLLQYALTELFERRDGRTLTLKTYTDIGGTGGALAKRADEIFLEGNEDGQAMVRQLFLRLVTLGEGAEDTRRRVERAELLAITDDTELMDEVIDIYARSRLLSLDHDPSTRKPTVEVAHEAILREWDRLRQWLNDSRDDIKQERQIAHEAELWQEHNRDKSHLQRGSKLEQAERWQSTTELALTPLVTEFIQTSTKEANAQELAEKERAEREKQQEQRSRTLLRALVAVFAVAAILSGGFGVFALNQRNEARDSQAETIAALDIANRSGMAFAANAALEIDEIDLAIALALESVGDNDTNLLPETIRVLERIENQAGPSIWRKMDDMFCGTTTSRDYRFFSFNDCQSTFTVWDMNSMEEVARITQSGKLSWLHGFSNDGTRMFTTALVDGEDQLGGLHVTLWDMENWEIISTYTLNEPILWIYYSSDASMIATMEMLPENITLSREERFDIGDSVSLRDAETGEIIQQYRFDGQLIQDFDMSPDGTMGVVNGWTGFDGVGIDHYQWTIFDTATGDTLHVIDRPHSEHLPVGYKQSAWANFSADSSKLYTHGSPNYAIDIATGQDYGQVHRLEGHASWIPDSNFEYVFTRDLDGSHQLFNIETGETQVFQTNYAYLTPQKHKILTRDNGRMNEFQIWDTQGRTDNITTVPNSMGITALDYNPSGQYLATVTRGWNTRLNAPNESVIYDAQTLEPVKQLDADQNMPWGIDWSPDGRYLVTGTITGEIILWDTTDFHEIRRFKGLEPLAFMTKFTHDSRYLIGAHGSIYASLNYDVPPYLIMWDVETGEEVKRYDLPFNKIPNWGVVQLELHPNLNIAYVAVHLEQDDGGENAELVSFFLDLESGERGDNLPINFAEFTPDGKHIVGVDFPDNVIRVIDVSSGQLIREWRALDSDLFALAISPDGRYIATGSGPRSFESAVSLWDFETGQLIRRYFGYRDQSFLIHLDFHPDGTQLASSALEGSFHIVNVDTQSTLEWVRENRVVREFTCSEREQYRIEPYCE